MEDLPVHYSPNESQFTVESGIRTRVFLLLYPWAIIKRRIRTFNPQKRKQLLSQSSILPPIFVTTLWGCWSPHPVFGLLFFPVSFQAFRLKESFYRLPGVYLISSNLSSIIIFVLSKSHPDLFRSGARFLLSRNKIDTLLRSLFAHPNYFRYFFKNNSVYAG